MNELKVGDRIMVQLTGGRLVDAEIKAIKRDHSREAFAGFVWGRDSPDLFVAYREPRP